jgi:hypothetical protein
LVEALMRCRFGVPHRDGTMLEALMRRRSVPLATQGGTGLARHTGAAGRGSIRTTIRSTASCYPAAAPRTLIDRRELDYRIWSTG